MSDTDQQAPPPAPVNVRVIDTDDQAHPIEMVYKGLDRGKHVWTSTAVVRIEPWRVRAIAADEMPADINLIIPFLDCKCGEC